MCRVKKYSITFSHIAVLLLLHLSCLSTTSSIAEKTASQIVPPLPENTQIILSDEITDSKKKPEVSPILSEWEILEVLSTSTVQSAPRLVGIRLFPQNAEICTISEGQLSPISASYQKKDTLWFDTALELVAVRAAGYFPQLLRIGDNGIHTVKLEKNRSPVRKIGELPTGYQPKSVRFSPDGQYLFTTHLGDQIAVSQYRVNPFEWIRNLEVPLPYRSEAGFVESIILAKRQELWISQMTQDIVHIFDLVSGEYLDRVELSGNLAKILIASPDEEKVYVSCWISNSISIIDTGKRQEITSIATGVTPRGLALIPGTSELLVSQFGASTVERINLITGVVIDRHSVDSDYPYAMRHIVHDFRRSQYYISAMAVRRIYRLSESGKWLGYWEVGDNPNTIQISPDGRWLAVSCRGPNNPDTGYLSKGYELGKIYFINLEEGEVDSWIWGRDQPTGLDISPDGQYLAFTDFLSHNLELYMFK